MKTDKTSRQIKALGLCSGGLDSILSALLLKKQGIDVTWVSFETPFFDSRSAQKASNQTGIPLIIVDITPDYMEMMKAPKAGFGKNMNPCMDCHALMFAKAGELMKEKGYDFLFSGEVVGQRPKSQNKNSLRYVEKNSGFDGWILRPLSAKCLPETEVETKGLVDRDQLMDINGRSRKIQMEMAKDFGVKEYPSPAGGCLLTDKTFSERLKDLMYHQKIFDISELHLLKHGRHFRLDDQTKVITGRSKHDNRYLMKAVDLQKHAWIHHAHLPGPDVVMTGDFSPENLKIAAQICAAYTRSPEGQPAEIQVSIKEKRFILQTDVRPAAEFKELML